jgi:hypothetical protein
LGIGSSGRAAPANVVVNQACEASFAKDGNASNRERRWYYYGATVPNAKLVGSPFQLSPKKRRLEDRTRRSTGEDEDAFED